MTRPSHLTRLTKGHDLIAGVDEAGRGPLAGPVVTAAVILPVGLELDGLDDSKRINRNQREALSPKIQSTAISWCIEVVGPLEIDRINILKATLAGMQYAVEKLDPAPSLTLIDGNRVPEMSGEVHAIVGGDHWVPAISAASILAKVTRDQIMREYHVQFPVYGFDRHKGYPTAEHLHRLREHGPCPIHRRSFAPVREAMAPGLFE